LTRMSFAPGVEGLKPGTVASLTGLVGSSKMNGKQVTIIAEAVDRRYSVRLANGKTKTVKGENLTPLYFDSQSDFSIEDSLMFAYHEEISCFVRDNMTSFAAWWGAKSNASRKESLEVVCPDIPASFSFIENLVPEWCLDKMIASECACTQTKDFQGRPLEKIEGLHGEPCRLLHDMHHVGTMTDVGMLLHVDIRHAWNLQNMGALRSPPHMGRFGTVIDMNGSSPKQLAQPVSSPALASIKEALEQENLVFAHVRGAAVRRRIIVSMFLVGLADEFRSDTLGVVLDTNARLLQIGALVEGMRSQVNLSELEMYLGGRSSNTRPPSSSSRSDFCGASEALEMDETLPAMMRRLLHSRQDDEDKINETSSSSSLHADPVSSLAHAVTKRGVCTYCRQIEGREGQKLRLCSGCGLVPYCSRECQKTHWPQHKQACKEEEKNQQAGQHPISATGPLRLHLANPSTEVKPIFREAVCALSPCDSSGAFHLAAVFGDSLGQKTVLSLWMRLGQGIERSLIYGSDTMTKKILQVETAEVARLMFADPTKSLQSAFTAFVEIDNSLALALIVEAEHERKTASIDSSVVATFKAGLQCHDAAAAREKLSNWRRKPLMDKAVLACVRDLGKGSFARVTTEVYSLPLERQISLFLTTFLKSTTLEGRVPFGNFDGEQEIKASGYQHEIATMGPFLKILSDLNLKSQGSIRIRYKRVFEFIAAWLFTGSEKGFVGSSVFARANMSAGLDESKATEIRADVAIAVHCASVQCGSDVLFSDGLFSKFEALAEKDPLFKRHKSATCSLGAAMGIRYHSARGRTQVREDLKASNGAVYVVY